MTTIEAEAEAEKIYNMFSDYVCHSRNLELTPEENEHEGKKQCAIIHVKGIIETMTYDLNGNAIFPHHGTFKHWQSILKELERK